eukprot:CAMPEP_0174932914 /NCGR_PEP_ID=MMETSP1355-20121228/42529_1 /TAXON_ID=464990 /ORGANISM="Hemiselmis tepida, Strain CCMP443" /LENGTH=338 /DNA_ID=CAMNT_0016179375 /DNA_START=42 /DNA_END=1054 /DNA_ORIENTATION=+
MRKASLGEITLEVAPKSAEQGFDERGNPLADKRKIQAQKQGGPKKEHMQFGAIHSCCFDPSGQVLLTSSHDTSYALRSSETGQVLNEPIRGHSAAVHAARFHPEGHLMATASADKLLKIWNMESGRMMHRLIAHAEAVTDTAFTPTGCLLASTSLDHSILVWDVESGRELMRMPPGFGHELPVRCVAASPQNHVICTGGDDAFVRVWDLRSKQLIRKLISHTRNINSCAFSADGSCIITGSEDFSARLWDLNGGLVHTFESDSSSVKGTCFTPSGRHIIVGRSDRHVVVYNAGSLQEVGRWVCQSACQSVAATTQYGGVVACGDSSGTTYVLRSVLAP